MGFFKKKQQQNKEKLDIDIPSLPHQHTWKDMPWYMEVEYNGKDQWAQYKIIEPYICVTCGERKNVTLEKENWSNIDSTTRDEYYQKVRKRYRKYLKPRAVVEDMINNILMVKDPGYLEMVEKMRGLPHSGCGTSSAMWKPEEVERDIGKLVVPEGGEK